MVKALLILLIGVLLSGGDIWSGVIQTCKQEASVRHSVAIAFDIAFDCAKNATRVVLSIMSQGHGDYLTALDYYDASIG